MNYLDLSKDSLMARGEYLITQIDTMDNKASSSDIESLPKGHHIVVWGPSSGKTTALRQFILENYFSTGVVATKLVDDVDKLYYDIVSCMTYLGIPNPTLKVVKFHRGSEMSIEKLQSANWIICTHERLFFEPPTILSQLNIKSWSSVPSTEDIYRKYLFIDEYPANLYRSFPVDSLMPLRILDYESGAHELSNKIDQYVARAQYINECYENPVTDKFRVAVLDNLPTPTNQNYSLDLRRGSDSAQSSFSRERITFFANILADKLTEYLELPSEESSKISNLYYTIKDLHYNNTYIFDGTGDLIAKDSEYWNILDNPKFRRNLKLSHPVGLLHSSVTRKCSNEEISKEYSNLIRSVINDNPGKNILVYTWKNTKANSDEDYLTQMILDKLGNDSNRVRIIHYMSGQERVTSDYCDCEVAIVLGKFFVPNSVIKLINDINQSNTTTLYYTASLIIQFIYRTAARLNNPIRLYFTDDYSIEFIRMILKCYSNYKELLIDKSCRHTKTSEIWMEIIHHNNLVANCRDYVIITAPELRGILKYSGSNDANKACKRLESEGIPYTKIVPEVPSKSNPTLFKIMKPTES